ncbi:MAG: enoyl-CoA hydratase/isomerase family protein [Hyphomicrobiaceae bacterium]
MDGVLVLTIDNQPKRNALTRDMAQGFQRFLAEAETDASVRCVVIVGAGDKAFCSGHDLSEMGKSSGDEEGSDEPFSYPLRLTKTTIAVLNGAARAGGFVLAQSCDIRISEPSANFAANAVRLGMFPLGGQIGRLPQLVPYAVAYELLATGRVLEADEAFRHGFINRISEPGQALVEAIAMARQIVVNSSEAVRSVKTALAIFAREGIDAAEAFGKAESGKLMHGPDAKEGIAAFLEKRQPKFA